MLKLGDGVGKNERAAVEVKGCQSLDLSLSRNGSDAYYLSETSDPLNFCKNGGNFRDVPLPNATSDICLIAEGLFYMQKTVTEVEPRNLPVSTNNVASPTVKDICIDQGVQCFEKILIEYEKVDNDIYSSLKLPKMTVNSVRVEEMTDNGSSEDFKQSSTNEGLGSFGKNLERNVGDREYPSSFKSITYLNETSKPVMNDLRSLIVNGFLTEHCYSGDASEGGEIDTTEITAGKLPSETIIEQKPNFFQEINTDFPQVDISSHNDSIDENQDLTQSIDQGTEKDEKLTTMASPMQAKESKHIKETVWSNRDPFEGSTSSFSATSAVAKSNRIDNIKKASDVKLHDGTSTSNLEPRNIFNVGIESKVINNQHIVPKQISAGTDERIFDGTTSIPSSFAHLIHENSILPGASALSGPIITSGHIPYSGNLSLRSDSSTTSTHSFAFPILQSEWNNSPIKMAKADRRKHRWRTVLCCKF